MTAPGPPPHRAPPMVHDVAEVPASCYSTIALQ